MQPSKPKFFSMNSYNPSNSSITPVGYTGTGTTAQPKSKMKLLIIVLISATVLITFFSVIGSITNPRKDNDTDENFIRLLDDFNNEAYWFKASYNNYIGFNPALNIEENPVFPFEEIDAIDSKLVNLEGINTEIQAFNEKQSGFGAKTKNTITEFKTNLNTALATARENVDFLKLIKNAFYDWFYESRASGACIASEEISNLISSDDEGISKIASKYKNTLCNIITQIGDTMTEESIQDTMRDNHIDLADVFKDIESRLRPIDAGTFELNSIFADLNKGEGN